MPKRCAECLMENVERITFAQGSTPDEVKNFDLSPLAVSPEAYYTIEGTALCIRHAWARMLEIRKAKEQRGNFFSRRFRG